MEIDRAGLLAAIVSETAAFIEAALEYLARNVNFIFFSPLAAIATS
jgi:hypothetical protein